jgi:peptidoglycan hydrolase-like protein with peptidoglycan-binding domain
MRLRPVLIGVAALAVLAAAGAAAAGFGGDDTAAAPARRTAPAATATVKRMTLVKSTAVAGSLSFGEPVPLTSTATGTVTWLPAAGTRIKRGGTLLRVDEKPIVLLYGELPMYRPLTAGTRGTDVRQFEENLRALGYSGFTVDEEYSAATTAAVKRWQKDLTLDVTGTVDRDRVICAPGALRIAAARLRVGASATGEVLTYTGSRKVVTVQVDAGGAQWAAKGTKVTVTLPGGRDVAGVVASIGTQASASAGAEGPDEANPGTGNATVPVLVTIADQSALAKFEKTPVDVRYVAQQRKNVLTVPVSALLALAEGGYGLEVAGRILPVETGMVAGGQVEVRGAGIDQGVQVGVPE